MGGVKGGGKSVRKGGCKTWFDRTTQCKSAQPVVITIAVVWGGEGERGRQDWKVGVGMEEVGEGVA